MPWQSVFFELGTEKGFFILLPHPRRRGRRAARGQIQRTCPLAHSVAPPLLEKSRFATNFSRCFRPAGEGEKKGYDLLLPHPPPSLGMFSLTGKQEALSKPGRYTPPPLFRQLRFMKSRGLPPAGTAHPLIPLFTEPFKGFNFPEGKIILEGRRVGIDKEAHHRVHL